MNKTKQLNNKLYKHYEKNGINKIITDQIGEIHVANIIYNYCECYEYLDKTFDELSYSEIYEFIEMGKYKNCPVCGKLGEMEVLSRIIKSVF